MITASGRVLRNEGDVSQAMKYAIGARVHSSSAEAASLGLLSDQISNQAIHEHIQDSDQRQCRLK